ncbi:hypothetical protein [Nocardia sp. A7]|uniref:hypothetical protein n=1 Tax=Nocardia sp. A7 TaxID=2789274 RepID=UPI00397C1969
MTTHVSFDGRPYDRVLEAHRFWAVVAPGLRPSGYTGAQNILEHLTTTRATGPFDTEFRYDNANVEVVAEVLRRIGAAEDGYYVLDTAGNEMACGGFAATAMDAARLGEILRCGGALGDRQVFPESVVASTASTCSSRPDGSSSSCTTARRCSHRRYRPPRWSRCTHRSPPRWSTTIHRMFLDITSDYG